MAASFPTLNNKTLNESILEALSEYILTNRLQKGDRLPSQITMAEQLNVSRTALREAIAHLEARGVVKQTQGVGTFIAFNPDEYKTNVVMETSTTEMIRAMGKVPGTSEVIYDWQPVLPEFKDSFPGVDELICVQRIRTADGDPIAVSYAYLAPGLVKSPREIEMHKHNESLFDFLEEFCGKAPIFFDDQIEIVYPDDVVAKKLGIDRTKAIFKFVRHQYSRDRELLVVASDFFNINKLSLHVTRYRLFPMLDFDTVKEA
jgi:GntR family transcriptional regulator